MPQKVFVGMSAGQEAARMARYGHRDWILYRKDGEPRAERMTAETIKAALLAVGTQGRFTIITASHAQSIRVGWRAGISRWISARSYERAGYI